MEFTGDRNELAEAIVNAANGIPSSPVQPIRAGLNITVTHTLKVIFTGSDDDVTFKSSLRPHPLPYREGKVTIPGRLTAEIVKSLPDAEVNFRLAGETVTITCGRSVFKLKSYKDEYPTIAETGETRGVIDSESFGDAVKAVILSASKKDGNPALHGLLLQPNPASSTISLVATDRYRVAVFDLPWDTADLGSCVIPTWAAERFRRGISADQVLLGWDDTQCTMKSGSLAVTTRQIAGDYPDWGKFFTPNPWDVEVNVEELTGAVKRAQLATTGEEPVELTFTPGLLTVRAGYDTQASETLDVTYNGEMFTVLFGVGYLLDGLGGCEEEHCQFGFTDPVKPVSLASGRFRYVLLPRRKT